MSKKNPKQMININPTTPSQIQKLKQFNQHINHKDKTTAKNKKNNNSIQNKLITKTIKKRIKENKKIQKLTHKLTQK